MFKYFFFLLLLVFTIAACTTHEKQTSKGKIRAGNLQVYYEQTGTGDAIVLLHAGLQNRTMWEEQIKALSENFSVITIDLPFHGNTTGIDTSILAKDVIKIVMDSLHLQKILIAGLSMGASVAQDFIIAYPERVNKAILISAGINGYERKHPIDSASLSWYTQFTNALSAKDTAKAAFEFTKAWGEGIDHHGDSLTKASSRYVYNTTFATLKQHKMEGWPNLQDEPPAMEGLSGIKIPVLIIHGDKDLPYITTASEYMEKTIPGSTRVLIKNVAHMLNMEKPAEVNKLMMEFLK
ncbi:MAG TPA: alpha/beta hydrolase [Chitinophagaceae bacterium]|nr:alpha/beta hydrolase [Chitinophagaceae bacterium]